MNADESKAAKRGYLVENYRLFHLKDRTTGGVEHHYHEFDKVVIFYSGKADYLVEGVTYRLLPGDVLFVRHHDIHRPLISPDTEYERAILWIDPQFLAGGVHGETNMAQCFQTTSERRACLCRPGAQTRARIRRLVSELERSTRSDEFGSGVLADTYFLQLIVELNRCVLPDGPEPPGSIDPKLDETIRYINSNLASDLSVDRLAAMSCLSRYYFMRRFKEATGCTVHGYVRQKRLARAAELLTEGESVTRTAAAVGFEEYSSFLRAFRKAFGLAPTQFVLRGSAFPETGPGE